MSGFKLSNWRPFRLIAAENGRHRFGGPAMHSGVVPVGTDVGVQLVISLDLSDPLMPVKSDAGLRTLPLFYPFKYGCGGGAVQYAVRSDSEIEILQVSDSAPDAEGLQYLQVDSLPSAPMALEPLTYEQARILTFMSVNEYFKPSDEDRKLLEELDVKNLIKIGGPPGHIGNAGAVICHNPLCEFYERPVYYDCVALVPPIPINGDDEFWYEFQGDVTFCFALCHYCGTVIAFNVAS